MNWPKELSRRNWMKLAGLSLLPSSNTAKASNVDVLPQVIVDTHTHFYDPSRKEGVPWPPKNSRLYRTVLPSHWEAVAKPCGVTHAIIVEASAWLEDNQWLLDLADHHPFILGVIGHLNPADEDFPAQLERFSRHALFKGIRISAPLLLKHVETEKFLSQVALLQEKGLVLEVNGNDTMLAPIATLARRFPRLKLVADHVGGSGDARHLKKEWFEGIGALKDLTSVYCKVSGIPGQSRSEWGQAPRDLDYYLPIFDTVWEAFGEDRLFYGSDWPVSDKGLPYDQMFAMVLEYFRAKPNSPLVLQKLLRDNSQKVYSWKFRSS